MPAPPLDLLVVGAGPAGRALARRAAGVGLDVGLLDPAPARPWPGTYRAWADELPAWLPPHLVAATADNVRAVARTEHLLPRRYAVLDTTALQGWAAAAERVVVHTGTAIGRRTREGITEVLLAGGGRVAARVVVDASGARRVLTGGPPLGERAAQTAVGLVVEIADAPHLFMDWRADHGEAGWPTFLYSMPLGGGRVLLEETSLARRPGLDLVTLRRRLESRLAARGIPLPADPDLERVGFVVDTPRTHGTGGVVAFGAAAPLIHPATGYSVAASLRLVDPLIDALVERLPDGIAAADAARDVVWPRQARAVHRLRRRGLEALLAMPPEGVVDFFELFFGLPARHQQAYLSERTDVLAVGAAMWAVFRAADPALRRHLAQPWTTSRGTIAA